MFHLQTPNYSQSWNEWKQNNLSACRHIAGLDTIKSFRNFILKRCWIKLKCRTYLDNCSNYIVAFVLAIINSQEIFEWREKYAKPLKVIWVPIYFLMAKKRWIIDRLNKGNSNAMHNPVDQASKARGVNGWHSFCMIICIFSTFL